MPDVSVTSAPPSPPTPQKIEKSGSEKPTGDAASKTDEREFADVLEEAAETAPAEAAMTDAAAAITAAPATVPGVPANGLGDVGFGGAPATGRLPAGAQPLRPEARAALGSALPEGSAAPDASAIEARAGDTSAQTGDDGQRFDARTMPGKPFELAIEKSVASARIEGVVDSAASTPEVTAPTTADLTAEASRRERPAVLRLDTHLPVHSPRFADGLNQQVIVLAQHGIQQAQLSLTPPDLGPIDVRITFAHDEASVQIAAPSGIARDAIQDALPRLKEMMEQSGVRLNDASVFTQLPQRDGPGAQQRAAWWEQQTSGAAPEVPEEQPAPLLMQHLGLVDAYA